MIEREFWLNIRGCLEAYSDVPGVRKWLQRAKRELSHDEVNLLIDLIHKWVSNSCSNVKLVEPILMLLSEFYPSTESERQLQFLAVQQEIEERIRLEEFRIQTAVLDKAEKDRLDCIRRKAEEDAKEEREIADAFERQKRDEQRRESEEIERIREGKRAYFIASVRRNLISNFLGIDGYIQDFSAHGVSRGEFEKIKTSFVQTWISEHLNSSKDRKYQPPDNEQASAIATVNGHVQVVARAGSGKTTMLVNRTLFLLKHCGIAPSQMLLLAFNRKAVFEIRRRLLGLLNDGAEAAVVEEIARRRREATQKNRSVRDDIEVAAVEKVAAERQVVLPHVMTFHALAYSIVHPEEAILFNGEEGEDQGLNRVFQDVIDDHLQLPEFYLRIRELMLAHFREDWDRIVGGGYTQSKDDLLKFRRSLPRESLGGDYVKSYGEKVIANFLFEHGIAYKYERNHWWSGINYRPDFTIFMDQKKGHETGVVIEYFGLAGDVDYDEMSDAKRKYWEEKKDWNLLELTPLNITRNGIEIFYKRLKNRLENLGVPCVKLSEDGIWHRLRERSVDRFTKSIGGFIGRCRKLSWSPKDLKVRIDAHIAQSPVETLFLELAHRLYGAYLDRLSATGEDDFDGLMQRAAASINDGQTVFRRKSGNGDLNALSYICIDEYQDFSDLFFRLLSAIRKQNPGVELFCVGDDWQAINGFAGSDLCFFQDFQKYIGKSHQLHISTNYRSSSSIVGIGNALMIGLGQPSVAHKKSIGKVLLSDLNLFEPSFLEKKRHSGDILTPAVLRVVNQTLMAGQDIVLLCRRNGLPYFVNYGDGSTEGRGIDRFLSHIRSFFPKIVWERITISTAHKYKGLEKSVVIVLDAVERSYPLIHPDWVFSKIFGDSPAKIAAEERRLLYVALTRAVDTLVLFTEGRSKSLFLNDIKQEMFLPSLDWAQFPSVVSISGNRLVVQVRSQQDQEFEIGTFAVKDQLNACRYHWHAVKKVWEKSFPVDGFSFDMVSNEVWATAACRVDVTIVNDAEIEVASYKWDGNVWTCRFDKLNAVKENSLEVPKAVLK